MLKTAEAVSLGHPDKIADYISSFILDSVIAKDSTVKYATEVMVKDNTIVLGGEISGNTNLGNVENLVKTVLRNIGYDEDYAMRWGDLAININKIKVINLIGVQSAEINQGVENSGWGDQGVFVGYACRGDGMINRELFLARKLNRAVYDLARGDGRENLGLDIKTQITITESGAIDTAIVAVPMLKVVNLSDFICETLGEVPRNIIVNGTGAYTQHSSVADCGITGRKLACDFYSTAAPIGGGSPWTKDGTKADLTLNMYARYLALEHLGDNDECWVYLSSCIGRAELPSGLIKTSKDGIITNHDLWCNMSPQKLIKFFGLDTPVFTTMCRDGLPEYVYKLYQTEKPI